MESKKHDFPYRHWRIADVIDVNRRTALLNTIPPANAPGWIRYDNACEKKWAMEDPQELPAEWLELFKFLNGPWMVNYLSILLDVPLAHRAPDIVSRGGGLHVMFPGGHLGRHIDYALHPSGLERRANLILFLDDVKPECGGGLALGDGSPQVLHPRAGEAVVWECGDETYHAVTPLRQGTRVTAAAYYLANPRPGCTRTRALFVPPR